ncbi:TRAP transporter small permease [Noviherbaspirillum sp. CPCC 100848]|uniref:TRAP transporter small permease protein n=1 Tax=Noviherbaspirillum album TaxID=3080276 RepID=A0ABU6J8Y8_9BURK|nr:TRAP transporter small permease [Noviherbaspirillum sp. CPCC 100848]MEC4720112.1 TRAP transporter small permease [Noviherbaspirillum sp. CPCC 100848]
MNERWNWARRAVEALLALMLFVMCVLTFGNVVLRYGFNSGISSSDEIARLLLVWLTFIGAVLAMYEGAHLGVDTIVRRAPSGMKKMLFLASNALMLICCVVLAIGSWNQVVINRTILAPVTGYPIAWMYAAGLFAAVGMGLAVLRNLWRLVTGRLAGDEMLQVADSEEEAHVAQEAKAPLPQGAPGRAT